MTSIDLSSLLPVIGGVSGAGAVGALLGYGFKKLLRVLLIVVAGITTIVGIPLGYLAYKGIITVDWNGLYTLMENGVTASANLAGNLIQTTTTGLPMMGGFGIGFAIGFKQG